MMNNGSWCLSNQNREVVSVILLGLPRRVLAREQRNGRERQVRWDDLKEAAGAGDPMELGASLDSQECSFLLQRPGAGATRCKLSAAVPPRPSKAFLCRFLAIRCDECPKVGTFRQRSCPGSRVSLLIRSTSGLFSVGCLLRSRPSRCLQSEKTDNFHVIQECLDVEHQGRINATFKLFDALVTKKTKRPKGVRRPSRQRPGEPGPP